MSKMKMKLKERCVVSLTVAVALAGAILGTSVTKVGVDDTYNKSSIGIDVVEASGFNIIDSPFTELLVVEEDVGVYVEVVEPDRLVDKHVDVSGNVIIDNESIKETKVLDLDLRSSSSITAYEIDSVLSNTSMVGLGEAYIKAEEQYGVNAVFLLSLSIHESGWGSSSIAQDKNNLFGYTAYDDNPYDGASKFETKEACIDRVARHLSEEYLDDKGEYFNGYNISSIGREYASDVKWSMGVGDVMWTINNRVKHLQSQSSQSN